MPMCSYHTIYLSLFKKLHYPRSFTRTCVNLSFKILGDNPTDPDLSPILILHGLLGTKRHWEGLGKTILNLTRRTVIAVDLRNHGDSPHASSHSYKELASDVLLLCKKLEIKQASLIGHSMGGRTAMCVSLMAPETVAGILIVDISPVSTSKEFKEYFPKILAAMKEVKFLGIANARIARKRAKRQLRKLITDDLIMRVVLMNINVTRDGRVGWLCNLDILIQKFDNIASFPLEMLEKSYNGPTLFIGGQLSEFIPADDLPSIREIFPQAVVTYIPNAGHNLQFDDPEAFLEFVISFMKSIER